LPLVSVITNIDYDHFRYLGDKLEGIAEEKAGIIKPNVSCFTAETRPKTLALLRKKASEKRSKLIKISGPRKFAFDSDNLTMKFLFCSKFQKKIVLDIKTKMIGQHQIKNACLAIEVAVFLKKIFPQTTNDKIKKGIAKTF
jgi:dihydrofolate synthase/folylpolyglutamate synthase